MPTATALRCFIAVLEGSREAAKQWVKPTQVNALWRDRTACCSSVCPTS